MKKIFLILIIIMIFSSCKKDMNGHWHSKGLENYEYIIDIKDDSLCFMISSLSNEPSNGKHFGDKKKVEIYAQSCGVYDFNYEIKHGEVFIKNNLNKEIKLEKRQNCNKIDDYKTKIKIEFLKLNAQIKDSVYNSDLNEYINIGFSKTNKELLIESWSLNGLKTINKIDSLTYRIEENSPEQYIPFINYILTPDKNITGKDFNRIISILNRNGKKKIYIRTLKENISSTDRNIFEYINLRKHKFEFDSDKTLSEIIKENYLQQKL